MARRLRDILAEARQTGHEVVHHISPVGDIDKFHPLSHFGTYKAARMVGASQHARHDEHEFDLKYDERPESRDRYHYKARLINKGNVHELPYDVNEHAPNVILELLHEQGVFSRDELKKHNDETERVWDKHGELAAKEYAANAIRSKGIHTLSYKNDVEDAGKMSYIITHPNQVHVIKKTPISVRTTTARDKTAPPATKRSDITFHS